MTAEEWVFFIAFTIIINAIMQMIAWKITKWMWKKEDRKENLVKK